MASEQVTDLFPFLDPGYFAVTAGLLVRSLSRSLYKRSWRAREFFDAAGYDPA